MKQLLFTLFLFPTISFAQTGTVSGNAFWKYNDYVGNKADAGSRVCLFTKDTTKEPLETQCDVQGNFRFDNVPEGTYLIAIISENTKDNGEWNLTQIDRPYIMDYLGFNIRAVNKEVYDSLSIYKSNMLDVAKQKVGVFSINKYMKKFEQSKEIYEGALHRLFKAIPRSSKLFSFYFFLPFPPKYDIREIEVKSNQTKTVVADFGITYL